MGKKDGKLDLVKQKKKWLTQKSQKYGSLAKLLLWGKRERPVGFTQFGPIAEFQTAQMYYQERRFSKKGWCITCLAVQPAYRRKGLALRLIRNILRDLKRRGVKRIDAYPYKKARFWSQVPTGPVSLYEKVGFEPLFETGKEKEILVMRKKL